MSIAKPLEGGQANHELKEALFRLLEELSQFCSLLEALSPQSGVPILPFLVVLRITFVAHAK